MKDALTNAADAARRAVDHLQLALGDADAVAAIPLLNLIRRAAKLEAETRALLGAVIEAGAQS